MASVRTVDSVWRGDKPEFSFMGDDGEQVTLVSTGINFTDESLGLVYCLPSNADMVMNQLRALEGEECEFILEESAPTKKGKIKWKVKSWPGKKGSECRILSEGKAGSADDGGAGGRPSVPAAETGGEGEATPPSPVSLVKETFDADEMMADDDDWTVAMEAFGVSSRAPIRVAFRKAHGGKSIADVYGEADRLPVSVLEILMAEVLLVGSVNSGTNQNHQA